MGLQQEGGWMNWAARHSVPQFPLFLFGLRSCSLLVGRAAGAGWPSQVEGVSLHSRYPSCPPACSMALPSCQGAVI